MTQEILDILEQAEQVEFLDQWVQRARWDHLVLQGQWEVQDKLEHLVVLEVPVSQASKVLLVAVVHLARRARWDRLDRKA